ncbi:HIT-like domain-containing protein [Syncephalis plumigaleata]|nr:HIT-like domain-containing protein [Syncephalis plumigaleata]
MASTTSNTALDSAVVDTSSTVDIRQFKLTRILNEEPYSKAIFLLGTLPDPSIASGEPVDTLLIAEKLHFTPSEITLFTQRRLGETQVTGRNDVYHWLKGKFNEAPTSIVNTIDTTRDGSPGAASSSTSIEYDWWDVKMTIIYPATEAHIRKYTYQEQRVIRETAEIYTSVVVPYITALSPSRLQWIYNILDGISEQDRILYQDPDPHTGFVLLPDSKWDGQTMESLYLVAISQARGIRSLRDLRACHLPLLRGMRDRIRKVAYERFNLPGHQLRLFFHYQPTYYHLHVHVTHVRNDKLSGMTVGQSYLLDNVISTLECMDKYYEQCSITYILGVNHPLYPELEKHNAVVTLDDDDNNNSQ